MLYDLESGTTKLHESDKLLFDWVLQRFKSHDASFAERLAALAGAGAMKAKIKFAVGLKRPNYKQVMRKCLKVLEKSK